MDEIGMEASTTVEAWPLGVDPKQKPLYTLKADGRRLQNGGWRAVGDPARPGRYRVVVGLQAGHRRTAFRYLRAAARLFDPPGYPDHALRGLEVRGSSPMHAEGPPWWRADVRFSGACDPRSSDHERRSEAGADAAILRGRQRVSDAGRNARARPEDFHQPELSVGARDGDDHDSDCARRS